MTAAAADAAPTSGRRILNGLNFIDGKLVAIDWYLVVVLLLLKPIISSVMFGYV